MAIDLYYVIPSPPSRAVIIVAKHLGIELNLINVDLMSGKQKKPEFEKINLAKHVPVINDNGFYLAESRAVITYLVNQYTPGHALYPADPKKRVRIVIEFCTSERKCLSEDDSLHVLSFSKGNGRLQKSRKKITLNSLEQWNKLKVAINS